MRITDLERLKCTEIMSGDFVYNEDLKVCRLLCIGCNDERVTTGIQMSHTFVKVDEPDVAINDVRIYGIPLTKAIFRRIKDCIDISTDDNGAVFSIKDFVFIMPKRGSICKVISTEGKTTTEIRYVHELQHILKLSKYEIDFI